MISTGHLIKWLSTAVLFLCVALNASAADEKPLLFFKASDESSQQRVDHQRWQGILDSYIYKSAEGFNRFRYAKVNQRDRLALRTYLNYLATIDPRTLKESAQKAFWINLYNAATVNLILESYPVSSITKIHERLFAFGPWDDPVIRIADKVLSLNDIEHRILRPFCKDHRIHYAVNCASVSCPELSATAFTQDNVDKLLQDLEKAYIRHPRGLQFDDGDLLLSKIYKWYLVDFAKNEKALLAYLAKHVDEATAKRLKNFKGSIDYDYDWSLNE